MAIAGWSTRDMIDRYTKSAAAARATEEARGLNLGDLQRATCSRQASLGRGHDQWIARPSSDPGSRL
ncbi:hypothetical protein AB0I30_19040 [Nocardia tengchongensis]|uniref:hypothetical protein n=1 Tax=Nocardia tengchongensis TaxID=2055889 RepID=UPI0033CF36AD